jgi:hypothetical protein
MPQPFTAGSSRLSFEGSKTVIPARMSARFQECIERMMSDRRRRKAERYPAPMREEFPGAVVTDMGIGKSCFGIAGAIVELDLRLQGPTALTSTRYFLPNRSSTSISTCTS